VSPRRIGTGMIGAGCLGKVRARWWALSLAALALGLLVAPLAGAQPAKVPRVGLLGVGSAGPSPFRDGLRQGLRELGYVEGQNIVFEDAPRSTGTVVSPRPPPSSSGSRSR
jgi:hypothetical protein